MKFNPDFAKPSCTISCKKDFLVNMGGILACHSSSFNKKFQKMLRIWEGDITNGGLTPKIWRL